MTVCTCNILALILNKFNPEIRNSITKCIINFTLKIIACKYPQVTAILTDDVGIVTINPLLLRLVLTVCQSPFVITNIAYGGISGKYDFLASNYTCRINTIF